MSDRQRDIAQCAMCDDNGMNNGWLCTHNPHQVEITRNGAAACRAALEGNLR